MAKQGVVEMVKAARQAAVPLLAVSTADQWAVEQLLASTAFGAKSPLVRWDCIRGFRALNEAAKGELAKLPQDVASKKQQTVPQAALDMAAGFGKLTVVFIHNAPMFLNQAAVVQAVSNLRDQYKSDNRMLLMLGPSFQLPATLLSDVVVVEEELPQDEQLRDILNELHEGVDLAKPDEDKARRALDAVRGLSAFSAETAYAMSLTDEGLDLDSTWSRKAAQVNQTPGVKIGRTSMTFDQLRGMESVVEFGRLLGQGPEPIRVVVLLDEIEKMLAGAGGDSSGVSQDALGVILRSMETEGWDGMIALGPPGAGKTAFAEALAGENDVPLVKLDMGSMKGELVGRSEGLIREAMRVVKHVAGSGAFFVGTCNKAEALPPELRRRHRAGQWFFDLPTPAERLAIWPIHLAKYGLADRYTPEQADEAVGADGWTGAEIRNVCERAWKLRVDLEHARRYVVPVSKSNSQDIANLRTAATGKFLSANHAGTVGDAPAEATAQGQRPKRAMAAR